VTTDGKCEILLNGESYIMEKSMPDMIIKNSLIGKKAVAWVGKVTINCPSSGWHAELDYHLSKDLIKYVKGTILCLERSSKEECLYIGGRVGGTIYQGPTEINPDKFQEDTKEGGSAVHGLFRSFFETTGLSSEPKPALKKSSGKHKKAKSVGSTAENDDIFIDFTDENELVPQYPPLENLPLNSSRIVWRETANFIVCNQMDKADEAKLLVEDSQRERSHKLAEINKTHQPEHFYLDEEIGYWKVKEDLLRELPNMFNIA
jgi:hypothetical protein